MRIIVFLIVLLLGGCSSLLQHKLERYKAENFSSFVVMPGDQKQFCFDSSCLSYLDFSTPSYNDTPYMRFSWTFEFEINQIQHNDKHVFNFKPLADNAPVMLMLPGYGMRKADLWLTALYFRELGMLPIILPGPTEAEQFDFGLNHAELGIALISQQFADRPVFSYSFSMGAVAVAPIATHLPNWQGGILVAPMRNFVEAGNTVFNVNRNHVWWHRLVSEQFVDTTLRNIQHTAGRKDAELDFQQSMPPHANLLILASDTDKLAPFSALQNHATESRQVVNVAGRYHVELSYLWPEMRQAITNWLEQGGHLPSQPDEAAEAD